MTYADLQYQPVELGREIGRGGEALIYQVRGNPNELAKVYHKQVNSEKAEKLEILSRLANTEIRSFTAIPSRILQDPRTKRVVGFTMPFGGSREPIFQLSLPKSRRNKFADKDYRFITRVALNTASAFSAIHNTDIVVGDVNESGVLVAKGPPNNNVDKSMSSSYRILDDQVCQKRS